MKRVTALLTLVLLGFVGGVCAQEVIEIQRTSNVATGDRDFDYYFSPNNFQRAIYNGGYVNVNRSIGTSRGYSFTWTYFSSTTYYRVSQDRGTNAIANFDIPATFDAENLNYVKLHVIAGEPIVGENNNNYYYAVALVPEAPEPFQSIPSSYTNGTFQLHVAPVVPDSLVLDYPTMYLAGNPSTLVDDFNGLQGEKVTKQIAPVSPDNDAFPIEYVIDVTQWYLLAQGGGANFIGFAFFMNTLGGIKGYTAMNLWANSNYSESAFYDAFSPYLEFSFNGGAEAVPEPLSIILLGVAMSFLGGYGKFKKKK